MRWYNLVQVVLKLAPPGPEVTWIFKGVANMWWPISYDWKSLQNIRDLLDFRCQVIEPNTTLNNFGYSLYFGTYYWLYWLCCNGWTLTKDGEPNLQLIKTWNITNYKNSICRRPLNPSSCADSSTDKTSTSWGLNLDK